MAEVTGISGVAQGNAGVEAPARDWNLKTEDFLRLLAAQLRYQNPLEPLDNTQFMNQLAQFAMLQQVGDVRREVQQVQQDLQKLQQVVNEQEIGRAMSLIGREIRAQDPDGTVREGRVGGVRLENGVPLLLLGDSTVPLSAVLEVR